MNDAALGQAIPVLALPVLAIYIHWPYCARICPYCDFNVYKNRVNPQLTKAILDDLIGWRRLTGPRHITSVHFGGGTPSLMPASEIVRILDKIDTLWGLGENVEIGLEANPNDADEIGWEDLAHAGVNRLSLGVQSFNDEGLQQLGRDHGPDEARKTLTLALSLFASVSLDMIFGWRGQTLDTWQADLNEALSTGAPHLSTYQLTIEAGTAFGRAAARGDSRSVDEEISAAMYEQAAKSISDAGYDHYEVSNFARNDNSFDHRSNHNLAYWRGRDYLGIGPGAHGRVTQADGSKLATIAAVRPENYILQIKQTGRGVFESEILDMQARAEEYVIMGLRISEGISLSKFATLYGQPFSQSALNQLTSLGLIQLENDRLSATSRGRRVLNKVSEVLLT